MDSVRIVRLTPEHTERLASLAIASHDEMRRLMPGVPEQPRTLAEETSRLMEMLAAAPEDRAEFAIEDEGTIVGDIAISGIVRGPLQSANVGLFVAPEARGKGVATKAIAATCEIAFNELELHRLSAGAQPSNIGSIRALERNGFERIGLARRFLYVDGAWRDHLQFQKLADD
jgi:[ribosomal protein S5]-alanine N-acetyltransferase